ncbi:MAG: hypothetical protein AB1529_02825 [Candidatus Micrarchaeota archaeon]
MKGQLSAEMLIMIVVIMAVVAIAATQLIGTAKETGENIKNQTKSLNELTAKALKGESGERCVVDDDCLSGGCTHYRCD